MRKGIRNTEILFLWLAGLIFFSHAVIPHHHHFFSFPDYSHQTNQGDDFSGKGLLHCHAFNNLAVDKIIISTNDFSVQKTVPANAGLPVDILQLDKYQQKDLLFLTGNDLPSSLLFPESFPTRGSPVSI